jgi:hypothetical protein
MVLRAVALLAVALASAVALLLLLPFLKEGYDVDELPLFAGIAAGLAVLALGFGRLTRKAPALCATGLALLLPSLAAYLLLSARLVWNEARGRWLARTVRVERLTETEIRWPGFDGPVGLRIEVGLSHAVRRRGVLFPPKVLMDSRRLDRRDYFFGVFDDWARGFLAVPLFQDSPSPSLESRSPLRVAYDLYPGLVQRALPGEVCLAEGPARAEPGRIVYAEGDQLAASWVFVGTGGPYVDLSAPLTQALRRESRFQGHPAEWQALLHRLEPKGLEGAGFQPCLDPAPRAGEVCYCRPAVVRAGESVQ